VHLPVDQALAHHHGAEDVRVLKLGLGFAHHPALALPDLEEPAGELLKERALEVVEHLDAGRRDVRLAGRGFDLLGLPEQ
jgi:hypothetical protein